jgi:hypothetical protein
MSPWESVYFSGNCTDQPSRTHRLTHACRKLTVEQRLNGVLAVRYGEKYLPVTRCAVAAKQTIASAPEKSGGKRRKPQRGSDWNKDFDLKKAPKIWQAAQESGCRHGEP